MTVGAVFPPGFHLLAILSLAAAGACAAWIAADEIRRPQTMWIMNVVWPATALFGSVIWLAGYLRWGRAQTRDARRRDGTPSTEGETPMAVSVAKGASHCGAGCTLGDLIAEWLAFGFPAVAVALGWKTVFADKIVAVWILDFILAFGIGVAFQYFTIKPMRDLSVSQGIVQALKADIASITSWQVGMYGFMAFAQFYWFPNAFGGTAPVDTPEFWFAMQIAMLFGFMTAYPVNWMLVRFGVKERM
jgi:hypothetical protein